MLGQQRDELKELRELLVGAYVLEVNDAGRDESLCEFVVRRDGKKYSFILFATDLGHWVSDLKTHDGHFREVQDIFEATFEHVSRKHGWGGPNQASFQCLDNPIQRTIGFKCCCGQTYEVSLSDVKRSPYVKFLGDAETREKIAQCLGEDYIGAPEHLQNILDDEQRLD